MNAKFSKRFLAFVIDILIFSVIIATTLMLFKENNNDINKLNKEIMDVNMLFIEEKINIIEYTNKYSILFQKLDKLEFILNMLNCLYIIALFIYVPFFLKGQTIGMKFLNIKIVKENGNLATVLDYFFRALIFYSLGYLIITLSLLYFITSYPYFLISFILSFFEFLLVIISAFMILYRHDRKGLHDIITHTKVVEV